MTNRNLLYLTALVIVESLWLTMVLWLVLKSVAAGGVLGAQVLKEWVDLLRPEWDMALYRFFIVAACLLQGVAVCLFKGNFLRDGWSLKWKRFFWLEMCWAALLLMALFKWTVYPQRPYAAQWWFHFLLVISLASKVFYSWMYERLEKINALYQPVKMLAIDYAPWVAVFVIMGIIFIPNPEAVVARMYIGEQFHHMDSFIMGPAWALLSGARLDMDVISQYGIGFVYVVTAFAKLWGKFSYTNIFQAMVWMTIIYYVAWFFLLRHWMRSAFWALLAVLLGMKWQMFHTTSYPVVFTYGSITPVRFFYDVFYFVFVYRFFVHKRFVDLWISSAIAGFGIFYFTSEGIYAGASLYAGLGLLTLVPHLRKEYPLTIIRRMVAALAIPLVFLLCLFLSHGVEVFRPKLWMNMGEFIEYFLSGFGVEPIYKTLLERKFLESFMGFVIPCFYVFSFLAIGGLLLFRKISSRHWWVMILLVYALGTYHYYIVRSVGTSYYTVALPFSFILVFAVKALIERQHRLCPYMKVGIASLVIFSLLTNHHFTSYPHVLNLYRNPMTNPRVRVSSQGDKPYFMHLFRDYSPELKLPLNSFGEGDEQIRSEQDFNSDQELIDYYRAQMAMIAQDAGMIQQLTGADEPAALISSFEIPLLMQANRRPFLYYFPLVISRPLAMKMFTAVSIYTTDQIKRVLDKLEGDKPGYIFMEKIFLTPLVPQNYYFQYPGLMVLRGYVQAHYEPNVQGQFLVAMKRKNDAK